MLSLYVEVKRFSFFFDVSLGAAPVASESGARTQAEFVAIPIYTGNMRMRGRRRLPRTSAKPGSQSRLQFNWVIICFYFFF